MKKLLLLSPAIFFLVFNSYSQVLKKLGDKVKNKSEQKADQKVDQEIDKGLDKTDDASKKKENNSTTTSNTNSTKDTSATPVPAAPTLKVYSNYDFVPGDKILFEDHFTDDQDGEFATHWELKSGQAVLNKINGELALHLTDGNYAVVLPRMKTEKYLSDPFTLEFDWYHVPGAYGVIIQLKSFDKELGFDRQSEISIQPGEIGFNGTTSNISLSKSLTDELHESLDNSWHHVAIAIKNRQMKIYLDQYRILVVPDTKEDYTNIDFAGIGDEKNPIVFKNVRLASGGNMNMIGKKFTDSKIVTHGINFDYNKAVLKPESMGTLNMILQVLKDNPEIKFEVGGHTDSDGADDYNLKLSQQRADAVKDQLIKMGVEASRLSAKGYGETKPISDDTTLEGKANNRRVEFVKM
ncbi:MAG: OmpA family protein [Bacteroidetes bacterium]|nr:MAG: OmpA family protein [Bacteroidota bacterium]